MKYKKFALLALAAGMIVGCGERPSAPDWSAEFKTFVSQNFHNLSVPYFGSAELGSFTYAVHEEGYAEIFGGELESSAPIKAAAEFLEEKGFVDLYGAYRNDPAYAQYASKFEWSYPMEYRFEPENVGPRYIRIGLSGKLPDPNREEEPAEPARSFYAQVFDPYYYSWFDSYSTELISFAFGQKTGDRTYKEDETIYEELVPYSGQATYESSGLYVSDIDDAIEEVEEKGYLKFRMQDVIREELDAYAESLKEAEEDAWTVYTYEEHELEPGYLGRLYKLVSPSKYFTIDVYFAEGEAMFKVAKAAASIPQVIKDMEPALFASNEVTAFDFDYEEDEETGASAYSYLELSEEAASPTGASLLSASAAYNGLVADENLNAVEVVEFGLLSAAEAQGVLDVKDNKVVVYADYKMSGIVQTETGYAINYYFFWGIEVSAWPTYPSELTDAFLTASGATNIHQFFEQEDGSFMFGTEAESEAAVASVFNAIKSLEGAEVLTDYENGIGRVKVSETKMAVIELITETETSETGEVQTYYGYSVTLTDIPNFPAQAIAIAEALGVSKFEFVKDAEIEGAWFIPANEEDTTLWAAEKANLGALLEALKTIPGIQFEDPQIQDENDEYWGSYYVAGLLEGKLVILQSVRVGKDENWNGYYSAQIIVADPKEEDPTVSAFMQAVASFLGIEVEFNQITGAYTFGEAYPAELSFDVNTMEATLREAFPDAEFTFELELDEYGDPVITIVYAGFEIEAHVEDWTFEEDPYYWIYADCEAAE